MYDELYIALFCSCGRSVSFPIGCENCKQFITKTPVPRNQPGLSMGLLRGDEKRNSFWPAQTADQGHGSLWAGSPEPRSGPRNNLGLQKAPGIVFTFSQSIWYYPAVEWLVFPQ